MPHRVVVFDSGMGGLTVARALREAMPDAELIYAADSAAFPYGDWEEPELIERILRVVGRIIDDARPDAVVVACNTASTLALAALRKQFQLPFVGTVPAIKPAAEITETRMIGVLATPGTVKREYTQSLIHTFAFHCRVLVHGAPRLAEMAEAKLKGKPPNEKALAAEIAPVFRKRGGLRTDTVVLGCTHYPLLLDELEAAAPWPVTFIDPSAAIAARAVQVLNSSRAPGAGEGRIAANTALFSSRRGTGAAELKSYASFGFNAHHIVDMPV